MGPDPAGCDHYRDITYVVDDPVALITLNRPASLNGWTNRMGIEVRHAVACADADPAVVGTVITGAGRAFCAGADMNMLSDISAGSTKSDPIDDSLRFEWDPPLPADFDGGYTWLLGTQKPVVAAINGAVAGMAVPIAMCCDVRFMAEDAPLLVAFPQRGLIAEWGVGWLMSKVAGSGAALDVIMSSRKVRGAEAERMGIVHEAMPADEVLEHSLAYVRDLAERCSPASMAVIKRQVNEHTHRGLAEAEAEAQRLMVESFERPDFKEGVQSFLQKRPPAFPRIGTR